MNARSFFSVLVLAVTVLVTGCAGTGGIQGRVNIPVTSNGHVGSVQIGGQGSNGGGQVYAPQQQVAHNQYRQPQQSNPCPQGIFRGYQGNRPVCELQPGQQPQQVQHHPQYHQPHQLQPQYQQQGGQVGSQSCPCVVTQWGKACGDAARSHQYNNPHMRLQCTR